MSADAKPAQEADSLIAARQCVKTGPPPDWVESCSYDGSFKPPQGAPLTYLLIDRQIHAEQRKDYYHLAVRLETIEAVQHQSQWRIEFEPRTEAITLHSIKIRRGTVERDHTDLAQTRLLQRESGLEGLVIDGHFTLLLLIEDVRPGDILEWCYTLERRPRLLSGFYTALFTLPSGSNVGRFRFSMLFGENRPMKWKASGKELVPVETKEGGSLRWVWTKENHLVNSAEEDVPPRFAFDPWIQVSDCPDWQTVAKAIADAWQDETDDAALADMVKEICDKHEKPLDRVESVIRIVQDDFRYLSVNLELGAQIPAAPSKVIGRRYGDCKDLSFLLAHLLRKLGVPARPVLVHSVLGRSVSGMLPSDGMFNHAVVEFTIQNQTRWVDAVIKRQGGGALDRVIPNYGVGLPVDASATSLVEIPKASIEGSHYELRESILLDTTGDCSYLAVVVTARGHHAEMFRHDFEVQGVETIAKNRLQACADRFRSAKRLRPLEYRDDRDINEFVLAEVFEINGFLAGDPQPGFCRCYIPNDMVVSILKMPAQKPRTSPFALLYPCSVTHIVEVHSPALGPQGIRPSRFENDFVQFRRTHKGLNGFWAVTFSLATLADSVPPERLDEHRRAVEEIWREASWLLHLPVGYSSPRRRHDFGQLPPTRRTSASSVATSTPAMKIVHTDKPEPAVSRTDTRNAGAANVSNDDFARVDAGGLSDSPVGKRRSRPRRRKRRERIEPGQIVVGVCCFLILVVVVLAIVAARQKQ